MFMERLLLAGHHGWMGRLFPILQMGRLRCRALVNFPKVTLLK